MKQEIEKEARKNIEVNQLLKGIQNILTLNLRQLEIRQAMNGNKI